MLQWVIRLQSQTQPGAGSSFTVSLSPSLSRSPSAACPQAREVRGRVTMELGPLGIRLQTMMHCSRRRTLIILQHLTHPQKKGKKCVTVFAMRRISDCHFKYRTPNVFHLARRVLVAGADTIVNCVCYFVL